MRSIFPDSHKSESLKSAGKAINYDLLFISLQRVCDKNFNNEIRIGIWYNIDLHSQNQ